MKKWGLRLIKLVVVFYAGVAIVAIVQSPATWDSNVHRVYITDPENDRVWMQLPKNLAGPQECIARYKELRTILEFGGVLNVAKEDRNRWNQVAIEQLKEFVELCHNA